MIEKIVYKWKFHTQLPNIDSLMDDCEVEIASLMEKFNPDRKKKAFSYFSVITRNWFYRKSKQHKKNLERNIYQEEITPSLHEEFLSLENPYFEEREKQEFFTALQERLNKMFYETENQNDKKLLSGIVSLIDNAEEMEAENFIFGKKAVKQQHLPMITGLSTREINDALSRIRPKYQDFVKSWWNA